MSGIGISAAGNKMRDSREGGPIECFKEGKCKSKLGSQWPD